MPQGYRRIKTCKKLALDESEPTRCFVPSSLSSLSWPVKDTSGLLAAGAAAAAAAAAASSFLACCQICTRKESPAHPAFMAFIAFMASPACCCRLWGNFAQKTPTQRHQIQLLLTLACPINACRILHLHLHLPKQQPAEASRTPTCLHRLHCLHGSHGDGCGKRAGARRGVRDPRSGCSKVAHVAQQPRNLQQTTSCTTRTGPRKRHGAYLSARRDRSHKR